MAVSRIDVKSTSWGKAKSGMNLPASSSTWTEGATLTLQHGTYIIIGEGQFTSVANNGARLISTYNKTDNVVISQAAVTSSYYVALPTIAIRTFYVETTICVRLASSVAINNCSTYLEVLRIA